MKPFSLIKSTLAVAVTGIALITGTTAQAAGGAHAPQSVAWTFDGVFGKFDRAQLQRGYQVYKEVCAACHSMDYVAFRNLGDAGGPELTEEQVKAIAAEYEVTDGPDDAGDMFERAALPKDKFPAPFANEQAARASNGGAYPPDLSLMAKARPNGPNYIYSLLVGYEDAPEGFELAEGMNYNPYFGGSQIAMAAPLSEDAVEYQDGTKASVDQMSKDVAAFMMWTAEPKLEERKSLGFKVMIYLVLLAALLYFVKRRVWEKVAH